MTSEQMKIVYAFLDDAAVEISRRVENQGFVFDGRTVANSAATTLARWKREMDWRTDWIIVSVHHKSSVYLGLDVTYNRNERTHSAVGHPDEPRIVGGGQYHLPSSLDGLTLKPKKFPKIVKKVLKDLDASLGWFEHFSSPQKWLHTLETTYRDDEAGRSSGSYEREVEYLKDLIEQRESLH